MMTTKPAAAGTTVYQIAGPTMRLILKRISKLLPSSNFLMVLTLALMVFANRLGNQRDHKATNGVPGDRGFFPILEENLSVAKNPRGFFVDRFHRYGPIFRTRFFGHSVVAVADAQLTSFVLCNDHLFAAKMFPSAMKILEGFMLVQGGQEHKRSRSLVLRALTDAQLKMNLKGIASTFQAELDRWKIDKEGTEIYMAMKTAIMKVMMEVLFGNSKMSEEEINHFVNEFILFGVGLASAPIDLWFTARGKGMAARARLLKWFDKLIEDRRKDPEAYKNHDLLQAMIDIPDPETGRKADTDSIAKNGLIILMAALDTTASTTATTLRLLKDNPKVLQKIREESLNVWGNATALASLSEEELYSGLSKLTYLDCAVQEALRFKAPVLATMRQATEDVVIPGTEYIIPKGWFVSVAFSLPFSEDPTSFPNVDKFIPERFFPNGESASSAGFKGSFTPFGKGSHQCPGWRFAVAETKIVLTMIAMQDRYPKLIREGSKWLGAREYYAPALEILGGSTWNFHE